MPATITQINRVAARAAIFPFSGAASVFSCGAHGFGGGSRGCSARGPAPPQPDPCSRNRKNGVAAEVTRPENPVHLSSRLLTSAATVDCMATAKSLRCHVDRASSTCRLRHFSEFSGTVSVTAAIRVTAGSRTTSRKATTTRTAPRPPSLGIHHASSYPRPVNSGLFGSRERQRTDGSPFAGARGYPTNQSLNLLGD